MKLKSEYHSVWLDTKTGAFRFLSNTWDYPIYWEDDLDVSAYLPFSDENLDAMFMIIPLSKKVREDIVSCIKYWREHQHTLHGRSHYLTIYGFGPRGPKIF